MKFILQYGDFLYFPEDKLAYIPAVLELIMLILLCIVAFSIIRKISKKQELKAKKIEEQIIKEREQKMNQNHS